MHSRQIVTLGILLLLLAPLLALAQLPPQGPGGFGGKKKGGWGGDPAQMWNNLTGGKDVWIRSEITDPRQQRFFDMIAGQVGVTDGKITLQQFTTVTQNWQSGFFKNKGGGIGPGQPVVITAPTADQTAQWDKDAETEFRQRDQNGDGKLNEDEMPGQLRRQLDKYDTNKDGLIDLNEYKVYYRDRQLARLNNQGGGRGGLTITTDSIDEATPLKRPDVFRVGNMPKNMPAWFFELDTDKDGQVGLYEWRRAGKSLAEFKEYDRNDDGFITADEVIRWMARNGQIETSPGALLAQGTPNGPSPAVMAAPNIGNNPWAGQGNPWAGKGKKGKKGNRGGE